MKRLFIFLIAVGMASLLWSLPISGNTYYQQIPNRAIKKGAFKYIPLSEGFTHPNSAWGSIGITDQGLVYIIVCDHITDAAIYEYNTQNDHLFFMGLLKNHLHHRFHFQRQPKVHTPLLQYGKDKCVYFGTDAGDESERALYGHFDEGYSGGFLMRLDPATKSVQEMGLVNPMGGTKSLILDQKRGRLYFTTSPACNLFRYDIGKDALFCLGRINGSNVVRTLFSDRWGNVYGATETGGLARYNAGRDSMEYLDIAPFDASNTGPSQVAYGPDKSYIIGYNAYTGRISKYYPDSAGTGKMEDLGVLFQEKGTMARNMNISGDRLYMVCTAVEEIPIKERFRYLLVYDIKEKKVIRKAEVEPFIHQAYGHPVVDKNGNMYMCGFWDASDYDLPPGVTDRVFLIKFNPNAR